MTQTSPLGVAGLVILCLSGGALTAGARIAVTDAETAVAQTPIAAPVNSQCQPASEQQRQTARDVARAAIDRLGGQLTVDKQAHTARLNLESTKVTDADMKLIQAFTEITNLNLCRTSITDVGLESVKGMTKLAQLELYETAVTDAGLEHLKGLTHLTFLMLKRTDVTDAGAENLQQFLPNCLISHSPRNPPPAAQIVRLSGRWSVEFANGVKQECEIREAATARVTEPLRTSGGLVGVQAGKVIIAFDDGRVERWSIVGKRAIVEHWVSSPSDPRWEGHPPLRPLPPSAPVLGIAERVQ